MDESEVIAAGRLAFLRIRESESMSFDDWLSVGRAVRIGRRAAMTAAKCNAPKGSAYNRCMRDWLEAHGLGDINNQDRHWAVLMVDREAEITSWRQTLPEAKRRNLTKPHGICVAWQLSTREVKAPRHQVQSERPAWKPKGAIVSFPQDMIKRAALAMRERWTNDTLQLARIALEAAIRTEADLSELIPQPKPAKPAASRGSHGFDVHSQPPA